MHLGKYFELARIGFREKTAYRLNAVMSLVSSGLYLLMAYYIWSAIASSGTLSSSLTQIMTYLLVAQIVSNSIFVSAENFIGDRIREGTIVNELKRPINLRPQAYFYLLGQSIFNFLANGIPVAIIGFLVLGLSFPSGLNSLGFLVSIFLGFNLVFALSYLTSMFVFWTKVAWSLRSVRTTVQELLSGVLFPLYLLPENLKPFFHATPFPSMIDAPISIFRMEVTGKAMLPIFGRQIVWIMILLVLGHLIWLKAKNKLTVQGG
jgi:ABC-2 type transport system permease protein